VIEHLEAIRDLVLMALPLELFDFLYLVLPEGPVDLLDGTKDGLGRVGSLDFREVDFLCFEEDVFDVIGLGQ